MIFEKLEIQVPKPGYMTGEPIVQLLPLKNDPREMKGSRMVVSKISTWRSTAEYLMLHMLSFSLVTLSNSRISKLERSFESKT